jgi:RNA polymerase sigma-70 factor (family 1)
MAGYQDSIKLIGDFCEGRREAFVELYDRYFEKLYITAFKLIRNKEEAKDITITTLNKLLSKHKDFDNLPQISAFLFVSARNRCLNYLRDMKRLRDREIRFMIAVEKEVQWINDELDADFIGCILKSVEKLPGRSRQVIEMYYLKEMKYREIANELNISARTVENQLSFALTKLRQALAGKYPVSIWILLLITPYFS